MIKSSDNRNNFWLVFSAVLAALFISGIIYRTAAARQNLPVTRISPLKVSLKQFPLKLKDWQGQDIPTEYSIKKITRSDDFLYRLYRNNTTNQWANIYITYCTQPRTMLGHRPEVCYTSSGWTLKKSDKTHFITSSGIKVNCIKYLFYKPVPYPQEIAVLNFYVFNGRLTDDHKEFSGIKWRTPASEKNSQRYVAQIQISSSFENSIFSAAADMSDRIIEFFPDKNGIVKTGFAR